MGGPNLPYAFNTPAFMLFLERVPAANKSTCRLVEIEGKAPPIYKRSCKFNSAGRDGGLRRAGYADGFAPALIIAFPPYPPHGLYGNWSCIDVHFLLWIVFYLGRIRLSKYMGLSPAQSFVRPPPIPTLIMLKPTAFDSRHEVRRR